MRNMFLDKFRSPYKIDQQYKFILEGDYIKLSDERITPIGEIVSKDETSNVVFIRLSQPKEVRKVFNGTLEEEKSKNQDEEETYSVP